MLKQDKPRILVIDDNEDVCQALQVLFLINQMECITTLYPEQGLEVLNTQEIDLVIQDMNFTADTTSGEEGVALFQQIRAISPTLPVILMTAWTDLETAVELVKSGAADYLSKPWDDNKLLVTVQNLLALGALQQQQQTQHQTRKNKQAKLAQAFDLCGLQYQSDAMFDLLSITTKVAPADVSVLITGPNGTGKEKIAEIIQANSACKSGPFIKVNVGALPKELMEAELFGAEAGAYTGISKRRVGRFELAHKGTLFLDEIGNLSLDGQAKLLRVLETGEFERIGGTETIKVNVRIVSATNADLKQDMIDGRFREDLYYRINVIELAIPPLCERQDDIVPLAHFFLEADKHLSDSAKRALLQHSWPGNIRELKNVMQRANLLAVSEEVTAEDLGLPATSAGLSVSPSLASSGLASSQPHPNQPEPNSAANAPVQAKATAISQAQIDAAVASAQGVMSEAARLLGISRPALYRRIKKLEQDAD